MDKQVILSLYGDAPTQPTHPHSPDAAGTLLRGSASGPPVAAPEPAGQNGPASDTAAHKKCSAKLSPTETGRDERSARKTNGTRRRGFQTTIAEHQRRPAPMYRDQRPLHADPQPVQQECRPVCGGIAQLNAFTDLNDALLYIQENYQWDPDSEGVRLLVDLLERKLG